ncbi:MAG: class I SAM-dependent rRNA methyltransferase [Crocinitomicaceae bacterium]|nr:class I SAM-dependent rRNA methyltransferase [Crocinitomicaceae bacterium]
MIRIVLKPGKEQSVRRFHPWIFSGAIKGMDGLPANGEIVEVYSSAAEKLGTGHYAEGSISVRLFAFGTEAIDEKFWYSKIAAAFELRRKSGLTDNPDNTIYRLINAEGDGLPGLIIDIYGETAVLQTHDRGMHSLRFIFTEALKEIYGAKLKAVFDKSSEKLLKMGVETKNSYLFGKQESRICKENGLMFEIDWETGQKTGFFIDQRDNRKLLGVYSKGKKVLNTFCYTGGFSAYALYAGASLVHSLDSSRRALELTGDMVRLNNFDDQRHNCIKADAVEYLKNLDIDYDIIVLDPPAFAKHLSARHKAVQGYRKINEAALRQIKKGGIIFTFSCSQAVDKNLFNSTVLAAAIAARRKVRVLHQLHHPCDHPISIFHPEGEYLKGLVLEVE